MLFYFVIMVVILLASNASSDIYGDINEANHFYNELPQTLDFEGKWSVALKEITYSTNVPTVIDDYIVISKNNEREKKYASENAYCLVEVLYLRKGDILSGKSIFHSSLDVSHLIHTHYMNYTYFAVVEGWPYPKICDLSHIPVIVKDGKTFLKKVSVNKEFVMPAAFKATIIIKQYPSYYNTYLSFTPGYYPTIEDLLKNMQKQLSDEGVGITLEDTKCRITLNNAEVVGIELKNGADILLGFRDQKITARTSLGEYLPNLTRGLFAIFVYCSICQPTVVGDVNVPLLRTIHMSNKKYGSTVNHIVQQPLNIPLNTQTVKNIEIEICDAYGKRVPFQNTKILMTLEFLEDK